MDFLANDYSVIYETFGDKKIYPGTPAIWVMKNGRYIFTNDLFGEDAQTAPEIAELTPNPENVRVNVGLKT